MTRRASPWLLSGAVVLAVVGVGVAYALLNPVNTQSANVNGIKLRADFGLREAPLTRFFDVDVCSLENKAAFAECSTKPLGAPADQTAQTPPVARTEISSAAVIADLAQVHADNPFVKGQCNVLPRGSQFPASQFKTAAENRGSRGLAVSVTADPSQPEEVAPGTYCGAVVVQLRTADYVRLNLTATVSDRGQGGLRARVLAALLLGALAGALVKWLGDRYAPVAVFRRRQRRLLRRLGPWVNHLPERVRDGLAVIDDGIRYFDPEGLDPVLKELEAQGDSLARFGAAMKASDQMIAKDPGPSTAGYDPAPSVVRQRASQAQLELFGEAFPWKDPDAVCERAELLQTKMRAVADALDALDPNRYTEAVRGLYDDDTAFSNARSRTATTDISGESELAPRTERARSAIRGPRRSLAQFLLDNVLLITTVIGSLVVMIVGYQTQFVSDKSFTGGNGNYLKLFLWAFALQVAGVTVAEVVGKLARSASSTVPASTPL